MQGRPFYWEALLHKEVYAAVLNGVLNTPGSKRQFARRLGIAPRYLSYLCNPEEPRIPSPALAARIAAALPLDGPQRTAVLQHMLLAREQQTYGYQAIREHLADQTVDAVVEDLRLAHAASTFAAVAHEAKAAYGRLRDESTVALALIDPVAHPLAVAQISLFLHDAQCALNRPDDALYHARRALTILETVELPVALREHGASFHISLTHAVALAYHNLVLHRTAADWYTRASVLAQQDEGLAHFWTPHLSRGKMRALTQLPRFSLREVEQLADHGRHAGERLAEDASLIMVMNEDSLAAGYLQYGNLKKAHRVLRHQLDTLDRLPRIGPLHRTLVFHTYARLCVAEGDTSTARAIIHQTLDLAANAGLTHQVQVLQTEHATLLAD